MILSLHTSGLRKERNGDIRAAFVVPHLVRKWQKELLTCHEKPKAKTKRESIQFCLFMSLTSCQYPK